MFEKVVLFSGSSAVGKTTLIRKMIPMLTAKGKLPGVCKIDCLHTDDISTDGRCCAKVCT